MITMVMLMRMLKMYEVQMASCLCTLECGFVTGTYIVLPL
jgi:hypothetical protein